MGRWLIPDYPAQINASSPGGGTMKREALPQRDPSCNETNMLLVYSFLDTKGADRVNQYLDAILVSFPTGGFTNQAFLSCNCGTTGNLSPTYVSLLLTVAKHEM